MSKTGDRSNLRDLVRGHYFLRHADGRIEACTEIGQWSEWMETAWQKGLIQIDLDDFDDIVVSTVFLGINHNFAFNNGDPILFETMIFRKCAPKTLYGGIVTEREAGEQWRYYTEAQARRAHAFIVGRLREDPKADLSDYDPLSVGSEIKHLEELLGDLAEEVKKKEPTS